jgi:hypothetical protein
MVATRINYSNILSQAWENIYDIVNNKSYVADPTTSSAEFRKWVYSRFPDVKANDFKGYPFIVIHPANVEFLDNANSLDNVSKMIEWSVDIDIYASDRQYNGRGLDGNGRAYVTAISDDIIQTFNTIAVRNTLKANNIQFAKVNSTGNDVDDLNNERIYVQSFTLTFRTKMNVTA